jgi:hypothetical protein
MERYESGKHKGCSSGSALDIRAQALWNAPLGSGTAMSQRSKDHVLGISQLIDRETTSGCNQHSASSLTRTSTSHRASIARENGMGRETTRNDENRNPPFSLAFRGNRPVTAIPKLS